MFPFWKPAAACRPAASDGRTKHASLLSFSSDAYLNEMGISNRLPPNNVDVTPHLRRRFPIPMTTPPTPKGLKRHRSFRAFHARPPKSAARHRSGHFLGRRRRRNPIPQRGCDFCHVSSITTGADQALP